MNILYIDRSVSTCCGGYESLIKVYDTIASSLEKRWIISFERTIWFEANLISVLGSLIEKLCYEGYVINFGDFYNASVKSILLRNGFLPNEGINYNTSNETFITYQQFTSQQDVEFNEYIHRELLSKKDFPRHTSLVGKNISENIFEIFENARTHGKSDFIYTCGQYYPNKTPARLDMTIVDIGVTILDNVTEFHKARRLLNVFNAHEAIEWAIIMGNTTKKIPGGLGLGLLMKFIKLNGGKVQIVSDDGMIGVDSGKVISQTLKSHFPGTIVTMEFNLNDEALYYMKGEKIDPANIF